MCRATPFRALRRWICFTATSAATGNPTTYSSSIGSPIPNANAACRPSKQTSSRSTTSRGDFSPQNERHANRANTSEHIPGQIKYSSATTEARMLGQRRFSGSLTTPAQRIPNQLRTQASAIVGGNTAHAMRVW